MRRYARLRTAPEGARLLFVDNDQDWAVMNGPDKTDLMCPDCDLRLTPKTRKNRFLSHLSGGTCEHGLPRDGGGGPMSPEHEWLQRRIATICRQQGHPAEIEHAPTNADVYIASARLVIEVQRWSTEFEKRTAVRQGRGHQVIWFVPTTSDSPSIRAALNTIPSARLRIEDPADRSRHVEPWNSNRDHSIARLFIYDALLKLDPSTGRLRRQRRTSAWTFLGYLLRSEIVWSPPGTRGLPDRNAGGWVSPEDLAAARAASTAVPPRDPPIPPVTEQGTQTESPAIEREAGRPALPPPPPELQQPINDVDGQRRLAGLVRRIWVRLRRRSHP